MIQLKVKFLKPLCGKGKSYVPGDELVDARMLYSWRTLIEREVLEVTEEVEWSKSDLADVTKETVDEYIESIDSHLIALDLFFEENGKEEDRSRNYLLKALSERELILSRQNS